MRSIIRVVDFRRVSALPLKSLRTRVLTQQRRLRLLPPYREHLSQAFARFFMRVGPTGRYPGLPVTSLSESLDAAMCEPPASSHTCLSISRQKPTNPLFGLLNTKSHIQCDFQK